MTELFDISKLKETQKKRLENTYSKLFISDWGKEIELRALTSSEVDAIHAKSKKYTANELNIMVICASAKGFEYAAHRKFLEGEQASTIKEILEEVFKISKLGQDE